jgi:hypothetical protein
VDLRHPLATDPSGQPRGSDAGDLVERGAALGLGLAGKAAGKFRKDRCPCMAADADDEGKSEARPVFRIPPRETGGLLRRQPVEPSTRLFVP